MKKTEKPHVGHPEIGISRFLFNKDILVYRCSTVGYRLSKNKSGSETKTNGTQNRLSKESNATNEPLNCFKKQRQTT